MNLTPSRLITLLGMGSLGAVAGHVLGYWAAHPQAHERDAVLAASGHGYMETAIAVALVAGLVALLGEFGIGYLGLRSHPAGSGRTQMWIALGLVQVGAFVSVELAERAVNGTSALAIFDEPAFWLGLPLQAVIAACGALVLTLARKAGAAIGTAQRGLTDPRVATLIDSPTTSPPLVSWTGFAFSLRAPPSSS